jgi:hypothetical protein
MVRFAMNSKKQLPAADWKFPDSPIGWKQRFAMGWVAKWRAAKCWRANCRRHQTEQLTEERGW